MPPQQAKDNYLRGHKTCRLKVGDKVKILRKARDYEEGWNTFWTDRMSGYVGKVGKIVEDVYQYGFKVLIKEIHLTGHYFPYFILEPVTTITITGCTCKRDCMHCKHVSMLNGWCQYGNSGQPRITKSGECDNYECNCRRN